MLHSMARWSAVKARSLCRKDQPSPYYHVASLTWPVDKKNTGATKEQAETATRVQSTYINMNMLEFLPAHLATMLRSWNKIYRSTFDSICETLLCTPRFYWYWNETKPGPRSWTRSSLQGNLEQFPAFGEVGVSDNRGISFNVTI